MSNFYSIIYVNIALWINVSKELGFQNTIPNKHSNWGCTADYRCTMQSKLRSNMILNTEDFLFQTSHRHSVEMKQPTPYSYDTYKNI